MGDGHRLSETRSGVRVVTEAMPSVRSLALSLSVRTGSRDETPAQAGISHFLEHLLFKGTDRFGSTEIDEFFDGIGAEVNAGTSVETTTLYSRFLDQHLESAFDVMSDMFLRPAYHDVDPERQVIIEEIAMYEDEPSDTVHDVLSKAIFGDSPLGRPVIGTAEVIANVPVDEVAAYHSQRYGGQRIVVAAAGSVDHDRLVALVEAASEGVTTGEPDASAEAADIRPRVGFRQKKDAEQAHVCVGAPGIARADERRFTLRVLDTIFGGSTSSRLFQEVREKRGLAYAVYSFTSQFADSGKVGLYVGTRPDNAEKALGVIGDQIERLREEPIPPGELERAKENLKGRTVLAMESTSARMSRLGSAVLMDLPLLSLDEVIERVEAVTADDVGELARELWAPDRLSSAAVAGDDAGFRAGIRTALPALAEAA